jgi:DNA-binding Xre family transcriptional regulator
MDTNHPSRSHPNRRGVLLPGLWAARVSSALSQRDLAEMISTNQGTVQQLETQQRGAYPKTVRRLCQVLKVEPADLMCMDVNDDHGKERK